MDNESIKIYLALVTVLQQVNFYQLVQATMKVDRRVLQMWKQ